MRFYVQESGQPPVNFYPVVLSKLSDRRNVDDLARFPWALPRRRKNEFFLNAREEGVVVLVRVHAVAQLLLRTTILRKQGYTRWVMRPLSSAAFDRLFVFISKKIFGRSVLPIRTL